MSVVAGLGQGAGLEAGTQGGQREEEMGEQGRHERGTGPVSPSEAQPWRGGRGLFHLAGCTSLKPLLLPRPAPGVASEVVHDRFGNFFSKESF